ncbi:MAG TPA: hypothetical protein DEA08_25905, partial [Planctomycetes bacterium]|nr:hypothetical protein [Planctomycetota bacterium]
MLLALVLAAPAAAQDDHPNGTNGANALNSGGVSGRIERPGDIDVFRFAAVAGARYRIETTDLGGGMDSLLDLHAPDRSHMQRDDDGGAGYASRIEFTASVSGDHYAVVSHYSRTSGVGTYRVRLEVLSGAPSTSTPAPTTPAPTTPTPSTSTAISALPLFDPKLSGAQLAVSCQLPRAGDVRLEVRRGSSRVATLISGNRQAGALSASWDGRDAQGLFAAPGSYTLRLRLDGSTIGEQGLEVVRVGILSMTFGGAGRVPLTWHRASSWGSRFPVDRVGPAWSVPSSQLGADVLDARDGSPLPTPALYQGLASPPRASDGSVLQRGNSLPLAYALGGQPQVSLALGARASTGSGAVGCNYPVANHPLRVAVEGGQRVSQMSGELTPGSAVTLDLPALPSTLGKRVQRYRFRFYTRVGNGWQALPGSIQTEHTLYTLAGQPASDLLPNGRPWVAALDLVSGWVAGARTSAQAHDLVTAGVNGQVGLRYDVNLGAPAYTGGFDLHAPELDLDAFLANQANGRVVNCLDCGALVNKLSAMVGSRTQVIVVGWNFNLYWLRGIGYQSFTASLFGV